MDNGNDVIEEWFKLYPAIRPWMKRMLAYMEITPVWVEPYFKWLKGKENKDLGEIRKTGSIQYRIIGCKGPGPDEFTLLIGATKTTRGAAGKTAWNPSNALLVAGERRDLVLKDRSYTDDYS